MLNILQKIMILIRSSTLKVFQLYIVCSFEKLHEPAQENFSEAVSKLTGKTYY